MNEHGGQHRKRRLRDAPVLRALLALFVILALGAIFHQNGAFFRWGTHRDMLRETSVYGILACGMTLVILTAGIDLSVSSVLGLASVSFSIFAIHWQLGAWFSIPMTLGVGVLSGLLTGSLIARFRLQPFIVTLAMMVFLRGLAKTVTGNLKISTYVECKQGSFETLPMPASFDFIDAKILGGNVSVVTVLFLLSVLLSWFLLARTRLGRSIYAVGGNEEAARLSGVAVGRTLVAAYAIAGFFSALAGICQAAQERQGDPEAGATYELSAIAIVVIGGTSLMGGRGSVLLTLIGALTIGYLSKILSINNVPEAGRLMLTGGIIVVAVLFQRRS